MPFNHMNPYSVSIQVGDQLNTHSRILKGSSLSRCEYVAIMDPSLSFSDHFLPSTSAPPENPLILQKYDRLD